MWTAVACHRFLFGEACLAGFLLVLHAAMFFDSAFRVYNPLGQEHHKKERLR